MWYILHKKGEELKSDNIEKIIRLRELRGNHTTFEGYCLSHRAPEEFELDRQKELGVQKNIDCAIIKGMVHIINEQTVKLVIWEWDKVYTFKHENYENEVSGCEVYILKKSDLD